MDLVRGVDGGRGARVAQGTWRATVRPPEGVIDVAAQQAKYSPCQSKRLSLENKGLV